MYTDHKISMIRLLIVSFALMSLFAGPVHASGLSRVTDRSRVCNAKNRDAGQPLIPVKVGDKTYYGCCNLCTETLSQTPGSRYSTDPVSGKKVDKATAVIGVRPDGAVVYFESEKSFREFSAK